MAGPIQDLTDILALEPLEHNLFRGHSAERPGARRIFGGLVIAQGLMAAGLTVDKSRAAHSLHAYFLLPGDPALPILYQVERLRDGRSFATRRVVATQRGAAIFTLAASFSTVEEGLSHQIAPPDVPPPEDLADAQSLFASPDPDATESADAARRYFATERPIELRPVDPGRYTSRARREPRGAVWLRARQTLPDDPLLHQCVLAYASDMSLLDISLAAHGRTLFESAIQGASLDHAMWLRRPFRADEWMLYAQDSPFSGGGRGFSRGSVFTRDGALIASVAQEGLVRVRRRPPSSSS